VDLRRRANTGNPTGSSPLPADDGSREGLDPNSPAFQNAQRKCAEYTGGDAAASPAQVAQAEAHALVFSKCVRSQGVPEFPGLQFGCGGRVSIRINARAGSGGSSGLDPSSPVFQKAQKTCGSLLPGRAGQKTGAA
jgi:hypothetical protein